MSARDNGGPAFPVNYSNEGDGPTVMPDAGMSLRDYFAAHCLTSLLVDNGGFDRAAAAVIARDAYEMADEMLRARQS